MKRLALFFCAVSMALAACGGGGGADAAPNSTAVLAGDPASPALAALVNMAPEPAAAADIVNGLILTRLDVVIAADATVGQINAALGAVGGSIVAMRVDQPVMTISVPRQAGAAELDAVAGTLEAQPGILAVLPGLEATVAVAPPAPANEPGNFRYLQNTRFPAAWNARAAAGDCTSNKVTVIVADHFHRPIDALYAQFATQVPGLTELGVGSVAPTDFGGYHGYDVLTTLAAKLDATVPTGANPFPECLDLKAVQLKGLSQNSITSAVEAALAATTGKVVVNASFGWADTCGVPDANGIFPPCTLANFSVPTARGRAIWGAIQRSSLAPFVDRALVVAAAGNSAGKPVASLYPGAAQARVSSAFNVAVRSDSAMSFATEAALWDPALPCPSGPCFPSLRATLAQVAGIERVLSNLGQTSAPRAANVMIVGSVENFFLQPSTFSEPGAHVFAVGEGIPTLLGVPATGTSFSAPQVAGLAAYLWMLSPDLRARPAQDTIAAIQANASSGIVIDGVNIADGIINAYATVLSLDQPVAVTPATAKVRLAILDVDGDGDFDLADLQAFHSAYVASGQVLEPTVRDYSRFDLNGDGFTGGSRATRMDLDPTGSARFGAPVLSQVVAQIGGVEITFNELAVSDAHALCFYANSALYTGDLAARDALLAGLCGSNNSTQISGRVIVTVDGDNSFDNGTRNKMAGTFTFDVIVTVGGNANPTGTSGTIQANFAASEEGPGCSTTFAFVGSGAQPSVSQNAQGFWGLSGTVQGTITKRIVCTGGFMGTTVESFGFGVPNPVLGVSELGPNGALLGVTWNGQVTADVNIGVGANNDVLVKATGRLN